MKHGSHSQRLHSLITRYRLDDYGPRAHEFAVLRSLLEAGRISDGQAYSILFTYESYIDGQSRFPDPTRYPTEEELHPDGPPPIAIGILHGTSLRAGYSLDPPAHALTVGESGAGKSTFLRSQVIALDECVRDEGRKCCILVIDAKNDFTDIPGRGPHWRHFSATDGLRMAMNPPASVRNLRHWVSQVSEILAARLDIIASATVLANIIRWLLPLLNPAPASTVTRWPGLPLIHQILKQSPHDLFAGKPQYAETLINNLDGLIQSAGPLLDNEAGLDIEEHLINQRLSAVISIANLKPASLKWIATDLLLSQILFSRLESGAKTDQTDLVVVIDEADTLISEDSDASYADGLSIVGQLLKQGRELGCSVFLGATVMSKISRFVREDVSRFVVFNQADRLAKWESARTLGLPHVAEDFLSTLKRGECVMRSSLTAWPHPVRVVADYVPPNRTPKTTPYDTHPYVPGRSLQALPQVRAALSELIEAHKINKSNISKASRREQTGLAKKLLSAAADNPFTPVARLWDRIGKVTPMQQIAVRDELKNQELMEFEEERIGSTQILLARLTARGWEAAGRASPPAFRGRGGLVHVHIAHWLAAVGRLRGHQTHIEWKVPGTNHTADVAWLLEDGVETYEVVVTSVANVDLHILASLGQPTGVKLVTIIAPRKSMVAQIEKSLRADPEVLPLLDRVRFEAITPYLKELWP